MVSPGIRVLRFEKRESERGIHPPVHASIRIPPAVQTANQEQEKKGDRERENGRREGRQRKGDHMSVLEK